MWTVIVVAAGIAMIGLVLDGGAVLRARSATFDLAAEAARAAAQQLDPIAAAAGETRLDPDRSSAAAQSFLEARGAGGTVAVTGDRVTVTAIRTVSLQILTPVSITVSETATAFAHTGRP